MKKVLFILILLCFVTQALAEDIIITKQGRKYTGKITRRTAQAYILQTKDGTAMALKITDVAKIIRGNQVLDFVEGMHYYLEVRRPFLPFIVLSIATGAYAVKKYQEYKDHHDQAQLELLEDAGPEYTNLNDQSKKDLAWSVVSGLFSLGSLYVALRPMEVKVPIKSINVNVSMTSQGVTLAFHF